VHAACQVHHFQPDRIDDVPCSMQLRGEFFRRREHGGFLQGVNTTPKAVLLHPESVDFAIARQA